MFTKRFLSCFLFLATTLGMCAQVPDYAPADGLQLWCSFNNTLNSEDANVNTISVSPNQCDLAMDRLGNPSSALRLSSQQGYVSANYSGAQPIPFVGTSNGLTVNLWYKVAADSVRAILAQCYDDNATNSGGWRITWNKNIEENTSYIEASYRNGSIDSCNVTAAVPSDFYGWHMVTFYVDVTGGGLYVDNELTGAGIWAASQNMITTGFANPVVIGNYNGTPAPLTSFVGKIDDVALWNRALTPAEIAQLYTGETTIAGCTNSNSCTYNEGVTIDDGTCSFFCQGCMDPCACNYDQNATTHIAETCVYDCIVDTVYIHAFLDLDADGIYDPEETPLENWPINYSGPDSALIYTNNLGEYLLPVRAGEYTFIIDSFANGGSNWTAVEANASIPTTQNRIFPNAEIDNLQFGFRPGIEVGVSATAEKITGNWDYISCSSGYGSGLIVTNTGLEILSGQLTLACDTFFLPGSDSSQTIGPDSVSFGYAEWNIDSLMPGASKLYTFHVEGDLTQVTDYTFNLNLDLNTAAGADVLTQDFQIVTDIDCDPQVAATVSAEPEGAFPPDNLILAGETITYRIQYRNVGPGILDSLRISINLNSDVFDISSALINYSSEFYSGCLHDDGTLELQFNSLMMPDTTTDPIGSMGYVLLQVSTLDGLPGGTEVTMEPQIRGLCLHDDGTLEIEIPVQRYVHHIFNCDSFGAPDGITSENILPVLIDPLIGTDFTIDLCQDSINSLYAEFYSWALPNINISDSSACTITLSSDGPNEISDLTPVMLIISNSLCADTTEFSIAIPVEEFDASHNIQAYPNPFENRCTVVFTEKFNTIVLYNSLGELIQSWSNQPSSIEIDHNQLSSGAYYLVAHSEQRTAKKILIAE